MTKNEILESFNKKAAFNLVDLMIDRHEDGEIRIFYNSTLVLSTFSYVKACTRAALLIRNDIEGVV